MPEETARIIAITRVRITPNPKQLEGRLLLLLHFVDLKMKPLGRQKDRPFRGEMRPSLVSAIGDRGVEIEQELVGKAINGRGLTESQSQSHRFLQAYAVH